MVWIVFGTLIVFNGVLTAGEAAPNQPRPAGSPCGILIGAVFIHAGRQNTRGTAKGTVGNGVGSLVFGLLIGGLGAFLMATAFAVRALQFELALAGGVNLVSGLGLLVAGALALAGSTDYKAWRKSQRPQRRRSRDDDRDDD